MTFTAIKRDAFSIFQTRSIRSFWAGGIEKWVNSVTEMHPPRRSVLAENKTGDVSPGIWGETRDELVLFTSDWKHTGEPYD